MQRPSDDTLIAYLDGELDESERAEIALWLGRDAALRARAAELSESAALLRTAFDEVLHEPLPERLIAAARGETAATIVSLAARRRPWKQMLGDRRWWIGVPVAASLLGLLVGTGLGYRVGNDAGSEAELAAASNAPSGSWLDSVAGYHKLFVNAGPNDRQLMDVPADGKDDAIRKAGQLPADFRMPNLKPWALTFQGARFLVVDGQPGTQLFYTTDNAQIGPLTLVVATSTKADLAPTFDRRDDFNVLYWRHHGHAYALVGSANIGYLWNIANDIAWQLDAI